MTKVVLTSFSIPITISIILVMCGVSLPLSLPVTINPPPSPNDDCKLEETGTHVNPYNILAQLESGHLSSHQQADVASSYSPFDSTRCEDGPRTVIYTVPNEFHWPPVYVGSCDGLVCSTSSCNVQSEDVIIKCVLVFQLINGSWAFTGEQNRLFTDHKQCVCKQCSDISDMLLCAQTKPCPDSNSSSYCFWNSSTNIPTIDPNTQIPPIPIPSPGSCECCTPTSCPQPKVFNRSSCQCDCSMIDCPPSQALNDTTCECECPEGSIKNTAGECVGSCGNISLTSCQSVTCENNPLFHCKLADDQQECVCPTCDDVGSSVMRCKQTKCLEHESKSRCVFNNFVKKCQCPSEYKDQEHLL